MAGQQELGRAACLTLLLSILDARWMLPHCGHSIEEHSSGGLC